jgi:aldehyde:ferredoxin oxidoreductase
MNDLINAAGRGGMGAVMGSKRLKAIAVRGHKAPDVADPEAVRDMAKWFSSNWEATWRTSLRDFGTAGGLMNWDKMGNLPTNNFIEGSFAGAEKISGPTMKDQILISRESCFACPIRCKRVVEVEGPYATDPAYGGPEYETLGSLGSACGVDDLKAIARGNHLCNAYTLDTISAGISIAFGMECFENGLLTLEDTGGIDLRFGNADAMLQVIELIARRKGIGDLLALGTRKAAEKIGHGADAFAMHVKGLEIPMHEPRVKQGLGMGYAVSSIGADHMQGLHDHAYVSRGPTNLGILDPLPMHDLSPAKVRMFVYRQLWWGSLNCLLICDHCDLYDPGKAAMLLASVTGWDTNAWELMKTAERSLTMARAFNIREGFSKKDDWLPERFFQPHPSTPPQGIAVDKQELRTAIDTYYGMMGWDSEGVPTVAKLHELGVPWVIDELRVH